MGLIVQKYGGTSVASAERIQQVAARVVAEHDKGQDVIVVVSAMGDTTDELRALADSISRTAPGRELDMLLSAGERISMALLAIAIHELGHEAVSFTGSQAGIITTTEHGQAKIAAVRARRIRKALAGGKIVIVAGFQGLSRDTKDVTTLGRGASDTTAVALAAKLGAEVCEIYTDVDGVYTADPRLVPDASVLPKLSYDEMLEMAASGARVLMARSVEFARKNGVLIRVGSSLNKTVGTLIGQPRGSLEKVIVSGITHDTSEAKITVRDVPNRPRLSTRFFDAIASEGIFADLVVSKSARPNKVDVSITIPRDQLDRVQQALKPIVAETGAGRIETDTKIAKVSLVGSDLKSHPALTASMLAALAKARVPIEMITTTPTRISCVIPEADTKRAVQAVHKAFRSNGLL